MVMNRTVNSFFEDGGRLVTTIAFSFPPEVKGTSDIHSQGQIQGVLNSFGRGVVGSKGEIRLGAIGSSHVGLGQGLGDTKRFYYGYSRERQTVYVVAKNGMDEQVLKNEQTLIKILSQVFDLLKLSVAPGQKLKFVEANARDVYTKMKTKIAAPGSKINVLNTQIAAEEAPNPPRATWMTESISPRYWQNGGPTGKQNKHTTFDDINAGDAGLAFANGFGLNNTTGVVGKGPEYPGAKMKETITNKLAKLYTRRPDAAVKEGLYYWSDIGLNYHGGPVTDIDSNDIYVDCELCGKECGTEINDEIYDTYKPLFVSLGLITEDASGGAGGVGVSGGSLGAFAPEHVISLGGPAKKVKGQGVLSVWDSAHDQMKMAEDIADAVLQDGSEDEAIDSIRGWA